MGLFSSWRQTFRPSSLFSWKGQDCSPTTQGTTPPSHLPVLPRAAQHHQHGTDSSHTSLTGWKDHSTELLAAVAIQGWTSPKEADPGMETDHQTPPKTNKKKQCLKESRGIRGYKYSDFIINKKYCFIHKNCKCCILFTAPDSETTD